MVDIINFSIAEDAGGASGPGSTAPDFGVRQNTATPPTIQHPQPQPSSSQLLQAQMTGFPTQQTGFLGQNQGLQGQPTGMPQPGVYTGPRPPMPPMPTGFGPGLSPNSGPGGMVAPLNAQPTGMPGQWGLVNTPATGLPNIDALQARMMPQQGREQGSYTTAGLQGNAVIPWAITRMKRRDTILSSERGTASTRATLAVIRPSRFSGRAVLRSRNSSASGRSPTMATRVGLIWTSSLWLCI